MIQDKLKWDVPVPSTPFPPCQSIYSLRQGTETIMMLNRAVVIRRRCTYDLSTDALKVMNILDDNGQFMQGNRKHGENDTNRRSPRVDLNYVR